MDFAKTVQWGQWCRTVAMATLEEDVDKLAWLEEELGPPHNAPAQRPPATDV
jgi:hypothetical protein